MFTCVFFFSLYRFRSRLIHRIDRGGVSQNRDHCMCMIGFVIVYTVNSELKRNSIRWYADRYRTRVFSMRS